MQKFINLYQNKLLSFSLYLPNHSRKSLSKFSENEKNIHHKFLLLGEKAELFRTHRNNLKQIDQNLKSNLTTQNTCRLILEFSHAIS